MTTPTAEPAGRLPNLIAPHYFAGQLLSDADLDALVGWTRARLALGGRRDGFGVVSGLELQVDARPGHEADLIVGPGYAVGPAGEDIVVETQQTLSLADVRLAASDDPKARHAVDVLVQAARERERTQPGFEYGDEVEDPTVRYSRVRERFKLSAEAAPEEDPERASVGRFEEGYEQCLAPLREFRAWVVENDPGPERIREWLRTRLLGTEFRFAAYDLDERSNEELREQRTAVRALFWLIQHRRNAFLSRLAQDQTRVRIGRAWLWEATDGTPRTIVALDAHPPYRSRLRERELPAPAGWFNAASVIWEREAVARVVLNRHAIRCGEHRRLRLPHRLDELEEVLTSRLLLRPDEQVSLLMYRHAPFGWRVVGVLPEVELEVFTEVDVEGDAEGDVEVEVEQEVEEARPADAPTVIYARRSEPEVLGSAIVIRHGTEEQRVPLTVGTEIEIGHEGAHIETDDDADDFELDEFRRHGVLRVDREHVSLVVTSRMALELNGDRVRGQRALKDGDVIKIGRTEIVIELEG